MNNGPFSASFERLDHSEAKGPRVSDARECVDVAELELLQLLSPTALITPRKEPQNKLLQKMEAFKGNIIGEITSQPVLDGLFKLLKVFFLKIPSFVLYVFEV